MIPKYIINLSTKYLISTICTLLFLLPNIAIGADEGGWILPDQKARQWNASVQQLHEDCSSELNKIPRQYWYENMNFFDLCIASKRLQQIALQYAMHEGTDDETSIIFKKEVETAFLTPD